MDSSIYESWLGDYEIPVLVPAVSHVDTVDFDQGGFSSQFWITFFKV